MTALTWKVMNGQGDVLAECRDTEEVNFLYKGEYQEGDRLELEVSESPVFLVVQVDDALGESLVYLTEDKFTYTIPFAEKKVCYSPKTFTGDMHLITARLARKDEINAYRNLALNVLDQHGDTHCYPHAAANVETRGESVFAARNAIDGIHANDSHGPWPYGSWGINQNPDAEIKVDFGRKVEIDKIVLYLRADFPHDNWWKEVSASFSDGTCMVIGLDKTAKGQETKFSKKTVEWVKLEKLIKADDPSPFPALTQIQVFGTEV